VDTLEPHAKEADKVRMFARALWLKDNLPITPDEWGLMCLLVFGDLPERRPTPDEFERALARHRSRRQIVAVPMYDPPALAGHYELASLEASDRQD
jgi:hypothetical protein